MESNSGLFAQEFKENIENGSYGENSVLSSNSFWLDANERSIWNASTVQPSDGWTRRPIPLTEIGNNGFNAVNSISPEGGLSKCNVQQQKNKIPFSNSPEGSSSSENVDMKLSSNILSETESFFSKENPQDRGQSLDYGFNRPKFASSSGNGASSISGDLSDSNMYFQPINSISGPSPTSLSCVDPHAPVDLNVTNLDHTTSITEMKRALMTLFSERTVVLKMALRVHSGGNLVAVVRVPSFQDAQYVISKLHRKQVGQKKICISHSQSCVVSVPEHYKSQIKALLSEVPYCKLPLSKFMELLESRYSIYVSVSELGKMKDICSITIENGLRMVSLVTSMSTNVVLPVESSPLPITEIEPYCTRHFRIPCNPSLGWAEQKVASLPNVVVSLPVFSARVRELLASHNNTLPLASFHICYAETGGELEVSEEGVPLEHLVTCVEDVVLKAINGVKFLQHISTDTTSEKNSNESPSCISPSLMSNVHQFKSELIRFLKTQPRSQVLFNKFIPGYHRHFGRQCRVADYGFTRLIDVLEALPNTVQVLGDGNHRIVTLAHQEQVRRFTSELQRVLRGQPMRKLPLVELTEQFERVLERSFDPVDYGLCSLGDLLSCVSTNKAVVVNEDGCEVVSLFAREQTVEEKHRTQKFAKEVVELFRLAANSSVILFEKFVPMYHHHFGYQCRVSDYGFTRLMDLLEAMTDTVKVDHNEAGERIVTLTIEKKLEVLGEQIREIVMPSGLLLSYLPSAFLWQHGHSLKPEDYDEPDLESLIKKLPYVNFESDKVEPTEEGLFQHISIQVRKLLINSENGVVTSAVLAACFSSYPQNYFRLKALTKLMPDTVQISRDELGAAQLQLTPLYYTVRRIVSLLNNAKGQLPLAVIETAYSQEYKISIRPRALGFSYITDLMQAIPRDVWTLYGKGRKRLVILSEGMIYREKRNSAQPSTTGHRSSDTAREQDSTGFQKWTAKRFKNWSLSQRVESQRSDDR